MSPQPPLTAEDLPPASELIRVTAQPPAPPGHVLIIDVETITKGPLAGPLEEAVLCLTREDAVALAEMLIATVLTMPDAPD